MKAKRLLTVLLTVALAVVLLAVGASAETIVASGTTGNLNWTLDVDGNMRLYGEGAVNDQEITWKDYKDQIVTLTVEKGVTGKIDGFNWCENLVSVSLPEGITMVSDFYRCSSLTTINIPSTVTQIDEYAFDCCTSLKTIKIPNSVTELGKYAFNSCSSLKNINLPEGITSIGEWCFASCENLEAIELPASLQYIGDNVFYDCKKLDGIWVNPKSQCFTNDDKGVLYNKDMTTLVVAPLSLSGVYTIPQSVTTIQANAFRRNANITGIILSDLITRIDAQTFAQCTALESITFPAGLTGIGPSAFSECTSLKTIYFTGSAPRVSQHPFMGVTATVYYPAGDESWAEEWNNSYYGGTLTWVEYEVDQSLKIVEEPKNTYTQAGKTAKVTVEVQGSGLKYQWYIKNAGKTKYSKSSVTSATYSCKMNEKSKDRLVYCVITDANGESIKTKTVILREAVSIVTKPKTGYAKSGKTVKVSVEASGDELTYQWYIKNAGGSKYSKSSITSATYSAKMSDKVHDRRVYCVVTDKYGKTVQSKTVLLRLAATITTQPKDVTVAEGEIAKVKVKAVGDELTYQWYIKNAGSSKFSKSSVTSATYSCKMSDKADGRQVYCVVTDKYGKTVTSNTVTLTMK